MPAGVAELARQPGFLPELFVRVHVPTAVEVDRLYAIAGDLQIAALTLLFGMLVARPLRDLWERRVGVVRLDYGARQTVSQPTGRTVLEMQPDRRASRTPRCAAAAAAARPAACASSTETSTDCPRLRRGDEGAGARRRAGQRASRLSACARRRGRYRVTPLLPASASGLGGLLDANPRRTGSEHYIAVLFADIRGFTSISEGKLPYDVVFLLNRYFRATGQAIEAAGGRLDKFIGDGVMAIFGLDRTPDVACRQALDAARRMALALDDLNEALSGDLDLPLRIGIGLHAGPAIVGEMGYERAAQITAIGDTVNTASRLEALTKEFGVELVVSQELLDRAGAGPGRKPPP